MYNRNDRTNKQNQRNDKPVTPKKEPKPKIPGIETTLVNKRVRITFLDAQKSITGTLLKVEKYLYVIQATQGTIAILKHAVAIISGIREEGDKPTE